MGPLYFQKPPHRLPLNVGVAAFLTGVLAYGDDSVSLNESGVPIFRFTVLPSGTLLVVRSLICTNTRNKSRQTFTRQPIQQVGLYLFSITQNL